MVAGVLVSAVIVAAFVLMRYANWVLLSGWRDIFELYGDVLASDRKRRAEEAARRHNNAR